MQTSNIPEGSVPSASPSPPTLGADTYHANMSVPVGTQPFRKRKPETDIGSFTDDMKKVKNDAAEDIITFAKDNAASFVDADLNSESDMKPTKRAPMSKAREVRLEQNRKAARESRRRKKIMIEELQRSVVFFSRANSTLKQQNDELQRMLLQAQARIAAMENGNSSSARSSQAAAAKRQDYGSSDDFADKDVLDMQAQQAVASAQAQAAQAAATQAMFQNQGFPPAAARQAAQTFVAGPPPSNESNQGQCAQNSWQYEANATVSAAQTMQNMQSILFGIQQLSNGNSFPNSYGGMNMPNPVQGNESRGNNGHGNGIINHS
eukprot:CAMPEP_0176501532 /NCGR_PEP_ID=MMETSP0200_2-20121128/14208_1 /TAXON_ID=947934 /ORGANISM="Chaetoceros sp., Strain GSL56" /LENGTH=320 /DNA_ID=CAMNT_0017900419 /DNA_START=111 /DNA_END=1073 /DNA_ORIENTATION=+